MAVDRALDGRVAFFSVAHRVRQLLFIHIQYPYPIIQYTMYHVPTSIGRLFVRLHAHALPQTHSQHSPLFLSTMSWTRSKALLRVCTGKHQIAWEAIDLRLSHNSFSYGLRSLRAPALASRHVSFHPILHTDWIRTETKIERAIVKTEKKKRKARQIKLK